MQELAASFIKSLNLLPAGQEDEDKQIDAMLSATDNPHELFGGGTPDESTPKGKQQKAQLDSRAFLDLYIKRSIFEGINGTSFITLYLHADHRVAGKLVRQGS